MQRWWRSSFTSVEGKSLRGRTFWKLFVLVFVTVATNPISSLQTHTHTHTFTRFCTFHGLPVSKVTDVLTVQYLSRNHHIHPYAMTLQNAATELIALLDILLLETGRTLVTYNQDIKPVLDAITACVLRSADISIPPSLAIFPEISLAAQLEHEERSASAWKLV